MHWLANKFAGIRYGIEERGRTSACSFDIADARLALFGAAGGTAVLSFGGLPRRFLGGAICSVRGTCSSVCCGTCTAEVAASGIEPIRMVGCFIEPSDIRFLEELGRSEESCGLSSAATDEQTEVIAVLVAESEEPYRQLLLVSIFQLPFLALELAELRSDNSVPDDDWLESSSSTRDGRIDFISGLIKSAGCPG